MINSEFRVLKKYFPSIAAIQQEQFKKLPGLYRFWNDKINVISRKDVENIFVRHILHSLAIAKIKSFEDSSKVLDVGTGGGFPGIPLAIMFPDVKFKLIDSIAKKIHVVKEISKELNLDNIETLQIKSTMLKGKYNYITGRAVTSFPAFFNSVKHLIKKTGDYSGILYLKGGEFDDEIKQFKNISVYNISDYYADQFFSTKKIIYLPY